MGEPPYENAHVGGGYAGGLVSSVRLIEPALLDDVNAPAHYRIKGDLEVIDVIVALARDDYYFANAIKYLLRHKRKGAPAKDLKKCKFFIDKLLEEYDA